MSEEEVGPKDGVAVNNLWMSIHPVRLHSEIISSHYKSTKHCRFSIKCTATASLAFQPAISSKIKKNLYLHTVTLLHAEFFQRLGTTQDKKLHKSSDKDQRNCSPYPTLVLGSVCRHILNSRLTYLLALKSTLQCVLCIYPYCILHGFHWPHS